MHTSLWIIAAGLLRFLPSCTASPIAAVAKPAAKQSATSGLCSNAATNGTSADCWTTLGMSKFLANWTEETVMPGAPMIGTIVCRPTEAWAQCFIRFAYGQQRLTAAPMDCVSLKSTSCSPPSKQMMKPTSVEYWYGTHAVYAIFAYIITLTSAILSTTGTPGALQAVYTSGIFGTDAVAAAAPNPIDAVLFQLLVLSPSSDQNKLFTNYLNEFPYPGAFNTTTNVPTDKILYQGLALALEARLKNIMSNWTEFESVLGTGGPWVSGQQAPAAQYVASWTKPSPVADGLTGVIAAAEERLRAETSTA
ncbi:MAG: hypothetical protein Q9226_002264 [Calogaya cf. arnoldii]